MVWLESRRLPRFAAVTMITLGFLAVIGAFVAAAIPPITHEAHELMVNFPRHPGNVAAGKASSAIPQQAAPFLLRERQQRRF